MKLLALSVIVGILVLSATWVSLQPEVRLLSRTIKPGLSIQGFLIAEPGERHFILQLPEIPNEEGEKALEEQGIKLLDYIPDNSWFASIQGDLGVQGNWIRIMPEDKISPSIRSNGIGSWGKVADGYKISVFFFSDSTEEEVQEALDLSLGWQEPETGNVWIVTIDPEKLMEFAAKDSVRWIEDIAPPLEAQNDNSRELIGVDAVQAEPLGLNGTGIVTAIWDSGYASHNDFTGRITIGDPGEGSVAWHGTHVTGTMAGSGGDSVSFGGTGYQWKGMAPNATILTYEWPDTGTAEALDETGSAISDYDARISQNSWGYLVTSATCYTIGNYDSFSQVYDNMTTGIGVDRAITIIFSAGNERDDSDCGQASRLYNTTPGPGSTAKNVITVGAVDSNGDMSSFSSWGPLNDGRIKPDIVAHGVSVKSTSNSGGYLVASGTSMAAPAVSGLVALLYEYYNQTHEGTLQNPATNKALLLHTATDINNTGPDYTSGYGIVNASAAIEKIRQDSGSFIVQSEVDDSTNMTYYANSSNQGSFKATLVWYDYPATLGAAQDLINDLDLIVLHSNGTRYYPWTLDPENWGDPAVRTAPDTVNNMEQVVIDNAPQANYTIIVSGTSVPEGPQNFTLILDDNQPPGWSGNTTSIPSGSTFGSDVQFNATWSDDISLDSVLFEFDGVNYTPSNVGSEYYYTISGIGAGNWGYAWYANDTSGNWNSTGNVTYSLEKQATEVNLLLNGTDGNKSFPNTSAINITATINVSTLAVYLDLNETGFGDNFTNGTGSVTNITILENGYYNATAHFDGAVNYSIDSEMHYITVGGVPTITLDTPGNTSALASGSTINLSVSGETLDTVTYNNGTGNFTLSSPYDIETDGWSEEGEKPLHIWANETGGEIAYQYYQFDFDDTNPSLNITSPENSTYTTTSIWVNYSSSDTNLDSTFYSLDGSANTTLSENTTITAEQGSGFVSVWANDSAGNLNSTTVYFSVDSISPDISSASLNSTLLGPGDNVTVYATYNDTSLQSGWANITNSTAAWSIMLNMSNSSNASYNISGLQFGNYTMTVFANDTAGNKENLSAGTFRIENLQSVTAEIFNANGSALNATRIIVLYANTTTVRDESDLNQTTFSDIIPNGIWDIKFYQNFNITLLGVNISSNLSGNISLDSNLTTNTSMPASINQFIKSAALETGFNFTKAQLTIPFNQSLATSYTRLNIFACHNWSIVNSTCNTTWENVTANSSLDFTTNLTTVNTTNLSAFVVAEAFSCGDGFVDTGETTSTCCEDTGCSTGQTCNTGTHACQIATEEQSGSSGGSGGGGGGGSSTPSEEEEETPPALEEHENCTEGDLKCSGNLLQECSENSWETKDICEFGCENNKCLEKSLEETVCPEGEKRCSGNNLEICSGDKWDISEECEVCFDKACITLEGQAEIQLFYLLVGIGILAIAIGFVAFFVHFRKKHLFWRF